MFIKELAPAMVGIGPFIPQKDTPFGGETAGTAGDDPAAAFHPAADESACAASGDDALGTIHPQEGKWEFSPAPMW